MAGLPLSFRLLHPFGPRVRRDAKPLFFYVLTHKVAQDLRSGFVVGAATSTKTSRSPRSSLILNPASLIFIAGVYPTDTPMDSQLSDYPPFRI
jgi:hypothetical protein